MKSLYIASIIILSASSLAAQTKKDSTTLNREMLLEREYNPTIRDASRLNFLPEVKEPAAKRSAVEFSNFAVPFAVKPSITTLPAANLYPNLITFPKKGYLVMGIGPFPNVETDLGYRFLDTETDRLGVYVFNRYASGNVKYLQNDEKQKMKINDTGIGLHYEHNFNNLTFYSGLKYSFSGFNYYGYLPTALSQTVDKNTNQKDNLVDFNLGVNSQDYGLFNYTVNLNYTHFSREYAPYKEIKGPRENRIKFDWDLNMALGSESRIGLGGAVKMSSYDLDKVSGGFVYFSGYKDVTDFSLRPYITFDGDNWNAHLGFQLYHSSYIDPKLGFAPDISFEYKPGDNTSVYMLATGGLNDNTMYRIFYENRYLSPQYRVKDSSSPVNTTIGIRSSIQRNFWFDIFAGYKYTKQEHFYTQINPAEPTNYTRIADNVGIPDYMDAGIFKIGGSLKYKYMNIFEAGLKLCYYNWSLSSNQDGREEIYAWNKPDFAIDANAGYKFPIPLRLDLLYHGEMGRKAFAYRIYDMKNINELNISASYSLNETISFFAKLNNILCQQYDIWYGYPAQNVNFVGGLSIKF